MSTLSAIKAVLEADSTLLATATGGIWDLDETGEEGINRTTTPSAFDSNLIIKPCVLVKLRSSIPDYRIADDVNQRTSVREMIEVWFLSDRSYTIIETMRNRVFVLLHAKRLSNAGTPLHWAGDIRNLRGNDLDCYLERSDYLANIIRSGS